ncbi:MAG: hypothetical protein CMJ40_03585 [Phycisphaerae bacterium]|nr:hypothetical protein [Phycisphaerae bacterium]
MLAVLSGILMTGYSGCSQQPDGNGLGVRAQAAADRQRAELTTLYTETLKDPSSDRSPGTRRAAAIALLVANSDNAIASLSSSLNSGQPAQVQAVLGALATQDRPEPRLEKSALTAVDNCPPVNRTALGSLLARYAETSPGIMKELMNRAENRTADVSSRETAIVCLGEFHSNAATVTSTLIELLKESDQPGIIKATNFSLEQLTGIRDQTRSQWRVWWQDHRDRPPSTWMRETIQVQNRRITELEGTLQRDRERDQLVINRLIGVYRELWPLLPTEEQLESIPGMLRDDLPDVRRFGVDRVAVLLRDGEATPAIEDAVLQRLDDPDLEVRRKVAALLEELSDPELTDLLVARMEIESDPEVLNSTLRFLEARGSRSHLPAILPLLGREQTRETAVATSWAFLRDSSPPEAIRTAVMEAIGPIDSTSDDPETMALLVLVSPDDKLGTFEPLLTHSDPMMRNALATAMLRRDQTDLIISKGGDPAIYPVAVEAALSIPLDQPMERINQVIALEPPQESQENIWEEAILTASEAVPARDQIALDDRLAMNERIKESVRIRILDQVQARDSIEEVEQAMILRRLAPLLIKANKSKTAVILLEPFSKTNEELAQIRFMAALHDRDFNSAATVNEQLEDWLEAYESLRESHPEASVAVRDEITQRFNEDLDSETRARLDISVDPMMIEPGNSVEEAGAADDQ